MVRQVTKTGDDRVLGPSTATILPGILVRQISKAEEESVIFPVIGSSDESLLVRQVTKPIDDQVLVESTFCDEPVALVRQVSKSEESISFPLSPRNLNMQSCHSNPHSDHLSSVDVLMIGTGEYTTGFVHGSASNSDKGAGVVALTMIDLRRKGKTKRLGLCGVNGTKFPAIRDHMKRAIADVYNNMDISVETFPADDDINPLSYIDALDSFYPGDIVTIFTPDDTHFEIALAAIKRKLHVMITKPAVKTLEHHSLLHQAAIKNNVLVVIEVHKRWDPIYQDARDRIQKLGSFSYMYSYMSQPKHQLETFKSWAGKSSDISYYLNSHHIDFHEWCVGENSRPIRVSAMASTGVAKAKFGIDCEDTITLTVTWENFHSHGMRNGR
jgi:D-galacturonate reductase